MIRKDIYEDDGSNNIVDVESFSIDGEEYKKVNNMNSDQQRIWLANKVLEGICGVDQIQEE